MVDDQEILREALRLEADAQRALLDGDDATAAKGFAEAADAYRRSWEAAGPASYGRLIGMLKARVLAGDEEQLEAAADYARDQVVDPTSAPAWYVCGIAAALRGETGVMRNAADGMRTGASEAFGRAADALRALADGDQEAFDAAVKSIHEDFAARAEHLTGVPIADTALMLEKLAARAA